MQSLKRRMIPFFSVILCTVLGSLLILGYPASANATPPSCTLKQHSPCTLDPNTGYKVYRAAADPGDPCYGKTAYAKFTFDGDQFPGEKFEETYPIQDGWVLYFNTPLTDGETGTLEEDDRYGSCGLEIEANLQLQLLSGVKTKTEAQDDKSGHFVVGKDYYAVVKDVDQCEDYDEDEDYYDDGNQICYKRLGSLTAIGGENFPALGEWAIGQLIIKPNAIRAPHWHLQFAEMGYCYEGLGQVGVIVPANTLPNSDGGLYEERIIEEMFIKNDEIFIFPQASQHYLRNIGNEDFKCTLFFAEDPLLNRDKLLTITLQNIVGNTPLGVLGPILVTDPDIMYTAERVSASPAQTYTSVDQGPDVIKVIETCRGSEPNYKTQGCPPPPQDSEEDDRVTSAKKAKFTSIYSRLEP